MAKLKEYSEYHGYYDGFYMQKVKSNTNVTTDDEWHLLGNLIQDIRLVKKGLAAKDFSDNLYNRVEEVCDNQETVNQLVSLADEAW